MLPRLYICYRAWVLTGSLLVFAGSVSLAGPPVAILLVKDALTSPNQPVAIDAVLTASVARGENMSGEPLELVVEGKVVATATTGPDGRAKFMYMPTSRGNKVVTVRTAEQARVSATATATVAAWERRAPILVVELAALSADPAGSEPNPDAVNELGKLTQFYYKVIYVGVEIAGGDAPGQADDRLRRWLVEHKFPRGYVLTVPTGEGALGNKIDELRAAGWTTLKLGVGRSKQFAEAFLQRRLDVVMVPEPPKSEIPRKARVAKDWKEVRKKL